MYTIKVIRGDGVTIVFPAESFDFVPTAELPVSDGEYSEAWIYYVKPCQGDGEFIVTNGSVLWVSDAHGNTVFHKRVEKLYADEPRQNVELVN